MALLQADEEDFTTETREVSPAHLLVKIKSFSLLSENGIWEYESREFVAGDHKWKLVIYPDGYKSKKGDGHISVYLSVVETASLPMDWEVNAMFSFYLFNQILDSYTCFRGKVRRFHAVNSKWGFSRLISKKSFTDPSNGYLVDDNCVFGAEVFVAKAQRVIECVSALKVGNPSKHDFVISQFSKLQGVWISEEFYAGDLRWAILLCPNGNGRGKGNSVSIYVDCVDCKSFAPHEKVRAEICIRMKNKIRNADLDKKFQNWYSSSAKSRGCHQFIPIGDVRDPGKGYVVDDCCSLEIEISVKAVVRDAPK